MNVILLLILGASAFEETFERSVQTYREQDYPASILALEQLVQQGVESPEVFYNLGNAYYRNGSLGRAVANYERALQLDPGMEDARENLSLSIGQTQGRMLSKPPPPEWERAFLFWHEPLRPRASFTLAALSWTLLWMLLCIREVKRLPFLRRSAAVATFLAIAFTASWWVKTHPDALAVAVNDSIPVRYGTDESEKVRFELFEGDRVRVDEISEDWIQISTWDGERGWARAEDFVYVNPPS